MLKERIHRIKRDIIKKYKSKFDVDYEQTCILPDKMYIKRKYYRRMGKKLNLAHPTTYSEKIQWLKLYDRRPEYTTMVDKNLAKDYVAKIIGEEYIIPTLGVWDKFDDIDFDKLPNQFVLKCTHDSGGLVICKDKRTLNISSAKEKIERSLKCNYFLHGREWPYKNVKPRIIAEKYVVDKNGELNDYKFFCFDGIVMALFVATDRPFDTRFDFFDSSFNHLPIVNGHPNADKPIEVPENFDEMKAIAEKLSIGIPHVRIDLYNVDSKIYFGEMTFSHYCGMTPFEPEEWDKKFGEWINLPSKRRR